MSTRQISIWATGLALCVCIGLTPDIARGAGACCLPDGCCQNTATQNACIGLGGSYLDGFACGDGFSDGFCIDQQPPAGPANDSCGTNIPLISFSTHTFGCNVGADPDTGLPSQCATATTPYDGTPAVWYRLVGPAAAGSNSTVTVTTCNPGTDFDTKIHVYCNTCNNLICVGGNDDTGIQVCSTKSWCAIGGQTYYILISGTISDPDGSFEISATNGTSCTNPPACAPPTGACCPFGGAACVGPITQSDCVNIHGGTYAGNGTTCAQINCTQGACCDRLAGTCALMEQAPCESQNPPGRFIFLGNGTRCTPNPCPPPSTGACCAPNQNGCPMCIIATQLNCTNQGGVYFGDDIVCSPNLCDGVFPVTCGACCDDRPDVGTGACVQAQAQNCNTAGGFAFFPNTACTPSPCALAAGRCCMTDGSCQELSQNACNNIQGAIFHANENCTIVCPQPPPTNDTCQTAIPATFGTHYLADNTSATNNPGTCVTGALNHGVWYKFTGTGNSVTATTCNPGSNYDTMIRIWCSDCAQLTCVAGNDDAACSFSGLRSTVTFCTQLGGQYYVEVGGFGGGIGISDLTITDGAPCTATVLCLPPLGACCVGSGNPMTFTCSDTGDQAACTAAGGTFIGAFTHCNDGAPGITNRCDCNGNHIVDTQDLTTGSTDCDHNFLLDECQNPNPNTVGACCDPMTASCMTVTAQACTAAGGSFLGNCTACNGNNTCSQGSNSCSTPTPIIEGTVTFTTVGATTDGPAQTGCGAGFGSDIWYCYRPVCTGTATISLCGSGYDTMLSVYPACSPCPTTSATICNDDFCGLQSQVSFPVMAGGQYLVRVGGYNAATGTGTMTITNTFCGGACCTGANCALQTQAQCSTAGGTYLGDNTVCSPAGACCVAGQQCVFTRQACCQAAGGAFLGEGINCGTGTLVVEASPNLAIPDCAGGVNNPVSTTQTISNDCANITDLDVQLDITHTWVGDLFITLTHVQSGTTVCLLSRVGFVETNPHCSAGVCCGSATDDIHITLDDSAANSVETGPFPLSGNYHPDAGASGLPGTLSTFNGLSRCSDWRLTAEDGFGGDTGTIVHWALRFAVQGPNPCGGAGACCVNGTCSGMVTPSDCATVLHGVFLGSGTDCTGNPCNQGACCAANGNCSISTQAACTGAFRGLLTTCTPNPCVGGCCNPSTGACTVVTQTACLAGSGNYRGDGTSCTPDPCPLPDSCATARVIPSLPFNTSINNATATADGPSGPCDDSPAVMQNDLWYRWTATSNCTATATVTPTYNAVLIVWRGANCGSLTMVDCQECPTGQAGCPDGTAPEVSIFAATAGETYWFQFGKEGTTSGGGPTMFSVTCSSGTGACCAPAQACQVLGLGACIGISGTYQGDGTTCTSGSCPGACCRPDQTCFIASNQTACQTAGGTYVGAGTDCGVLEQMVGPGLNLAIPDNGYTGTLASMTASNMTVTGGPTMISSVVVEIGMSHTFIGDLVMKLRSPNGTVVFLVSRAGMAETVDGAGSGNCCGDSSNLGTAFPIRYDDTNATSSEQMGADAPGTDDVIGVGTAFLGTFFTSGFGGVNHTLAGFNGQNSNGMWTLFIADGAGIDTGTLDRWKLTIVGAGVGPCAGATGACCKPDGTCASLTAGGCASASGTFQSGVACASANCPPARACCMTNGSCQLLTQAACMTAGGNWNASAMVCSPNPCPQVGACCLANGTCNTQSQAACTAAGGDYRGDNTSCGTQQCTVGACCMANQSCLSLTQAGCIAQGGTYAGAVSCTPNYAYVQCSNTLEDISTTGTLLSLGDNDSVVITHGFNFNFYGTNHTDVRVSSNGFLTFGGATGAAVASEVPIPNPAEPNDMIAGLWDDLVPGGVGAAGSVKWQVLGSSPSRRLIVQYTGVPKRNGFGTTGSNTFQIVLFEGSNAVEIRYGSISIAQPEGVAGVENQTGTLGVDASSHIASNACIRLQVAGGPCSSTTNCATCPGDMNGSSSLNGRDIPAFVSCVISAAGGPAPQGCACAEMGGGANLDMADVQLFVTRLLSPPSCP